MVFYDCQDLLCDELGHLLESLIVRSGLDAKPLIAEYKNLVAQGSDVYSHAVLMNGAHRDAPPFSNIPNMSFSWTFRENFEDVFKALGWPTTQQEVYRLTGELRRRKLKDILSITQHCQFEEMPCVQHTLERFRKWHLDARAVVNTMLANGPLLAQITDEEKEFSKLLSFDWHYDYIDEAARWRAARDVHAKVVEDVRLALAVRPSLEKVCKVVATSNGFRDDFFTRSPK